MMMASLTSLCHLLVRVSLESATTLRPLNSSIEIPPGLRLQWAKRIAQQYIHDINSGSGSEIRDWDLVLDYDGSVENLASEPSVVSPRSTSSSASDMQRKQYPAHFHAPDLVLDGAISSLDETRRKELFALGGLLYQVWFSRKPFENLEDREIRIMYSEGKVPEDVWSSPYAVSILCCWLPEFANELRRTSTPSDEAVPRHRFVNCDEETFCSPVFICSSKIANPVTVGPFPSRVKSYMTTHPVKFTFQVLGGVVSIASLAAMPILGAVGFAAAGPVAGSAAASWQASIGVVQAGSFFAWCQSAAMGGAAAIGITAAGVGGLTVTAGATALQALESGRDTIPEAVLKEKFTAAWDRRFGRDLEGAN